MKQTAVEWLIGRFNYEGFIGTYCSEEQIKSKRQIMIEIIEQAKAMEKEQILEFTRNAVRKILDEDRTNPFNLENYYKETYGGNNVE